MSRIYIIAIFPVLQFLLAVLDFYNLAGSVSAILMILRDAVKILLEIRGRSDALAKLGIYLQFLEFEGICCHPTSSAVLTPIPGVFAIDTLILSMTRVLITVGDNSYIGANAVVIKDVPQNSTVVGVPGRITKQDGKKLDISLDHIHTLDPIMQNIEKLQKRIADLENKK